MSVIPRKLLFYEPIAFTINTSMKLWISLLLLPYMGCPVFIGVSNGKVRYKSQKRNKNSFSSFEPPLKYVFILRFNSLINPCQALNHCWNKFTVETR